MTVAESIQNSVGLSGTISSSIASGIPLQESLDDDLGRAEWERILSTIPGERKHGRRMDCERKKTGLNGRTSSRKLKPRAE
ncbi:MAG TPA: hypothetical protein VE177_00095, partial [Candidatus Binatus sp.]|nr:hypothetical protein [Candidatus Binatus sp.]